MYKLVRVVCDDRAVKIVHHIYIKSLRTASVLHSIQLPSVLKHSVLNIYLA